MRYTLTILSVSLLLGLGNAGWAAPVWHYAQAEPTLQVDPDIKAEQLAPILLGMQWFAEQQAIRSHILFPKEMLEADVPIGPRWEPARKRGL